MMLVKDEHEVAPAQRRDPAFIEWLSRKVAEYVRAQQTMPYGYMTCSPGTLLHAIGCFATADRGLSAANLVDLVQSSANTVSRNLAVLERDGFVVGRGDLPCRYDLTAEGIAALYGVWGK